MKRIRPVIPWGPRDLSSLEENTNTWLMVKTMERYQIDSIDVGDVEDGVITVTYHTPDADVVWHLHGRS